MTDYEDSDGLLGPGSVLRQTTREAVSLLGAGQMVLLQLAHPLVAAGVAEHSRFQLEPLSRIQGTLDMMHAIVFASRAQAAAALRQFHLVHASVAGRLPSPAATFPAGTAYTGHDPALKWWVLATMLNSKLDIYQRFVAPLRPTEIERFYEDGRQVARHMGIPARILPPTARGMQDYLNEMLESGSLTVIPAARGLAQTALHPPVWVVPRACAALVRFVTPGLLPESLRRAYGLEWKPGREACLAVLSQVFRRLLPFVPAPLRFLRGPDHNDFVRWALTSRNRKRSA